MLVNPKLLTANLLLMVLTGACAPVEHVQLHTPPYPERLSEWRLFEQSADKLTPVSGSQAYVLNTALFSDYAHKLRTLYLPPDAAAQYTEYDAFEMPVGTIITKTFFYRTPIGNTESNVVQISPTTDQWTGIPVNNSLDLTNLRLLETRILVKQIEGWDALPYVWRDGDAYLAITGELISLAIRNSPEIEADMLHYLVPSKNQCASCHAYDHTSGAIQPLGIRARHLNRKLPQAGKAQLSEWAHAGRLVGLPDLASVPSNALPDDASVSLDHRARSYLDINCGHCHNPVGAADTSGLMLDYQDHTMAELGQCKPPIAAGRGSGGHLYSIVPGQADKSIMTYRLSTRDPGTMMPELGRTLVHQQGLETVSNWINSLSGVCR